MNYSDKLKDPRWQKRRLKIFERDNWICTNCYADETMAGMFHVHHLKYSGEPWDAPDEYLTTYCQSCHDADHEMRAEFEKALIEELKLCSIRDVEAMIGVAQMINRAKQGGLHVQTISWLMGDKNIIKLINKASQEYSDSLPDLPF
jgi:hypothetical protein